MDDKPIREVQYFPFMKPVYQVVEIRKFLLSHHSML